MKFHHQALPPEYLRHYKQQERKRRQTETNKNNNTSNQSRKLIKKSGFSDKETKVSEKVKKNEESSEVTLLAMEDVSKREENNFQDSERLKSSEKSTPPPSISVESPRESESSKRPPFSPEMMNLGYRSTEELLQSNITGIPHLNIDVSQNKAFLENLLTNQIEINRVVQKEKRLPNVKNSLSQFNKLKSIKHEERQKSYSIPPSGKIMNYSDLPYMGEITLDGIKPRRGRKPKKADICHLIYKNYGQVFPGAPEKEPEEDAGKKQLKWRPEISKTQLNSSQRTKGSAESAAPERLDSPLPTVSGLINHTEVQNRIINSLLEKRLTQEMKLKNYQSKEEEKLIEESEEPLNLCIRDLQSLKIKLSRKHGNFYETKQKDADLKVKIKTETDEGNNAKVINLGKSDSEMESTDENEEEEEEEEDDLAPFNLVTTELRESSDDDTFLNLGDQITLTKVQTPPRKPETKMAEMQSGGGGGGGSGDSSPVLFWPGSSLFLPGMPPSPLMCYPKLPDIMTPNFNISKGGSSLTGQERKLTRSKSEGGRNQLKRLAPNSNNSKPAHVITKRKRSAIFIPPVPAESTTNPTTEVSICKFKFTGGAKPSLQEKKMLSVDSGGNFRYYSGTGDKSMRGYEYFPRESLQQCQENTGCSPSGVFLTASALGSGEKIPEEIGHSGFFDSDFPLQISAPKTPDQKPKLKLKPKKPETEKKMPDVTCYRTLREHLLESKPESSDSANAIQEDTDKDDGNFSDASGEFDLRSIPQSYFDSFKIQEESGQVSGKVGESSSRNRKLRKTRKSLAREKLEQTFKEKGFLIQTQQLESAEGATYCKFRQLRKFTRYLFRSWKDYLPGNVRNLSVDAGVENPEMMMSIPEATVKMEVTDPEVSDRFK